ncbi:MAG: 16S rRNA (cytidine(1402)-2'-O)-methyltransferase [Deltaproteobacteria bacterium]|nr:16S rRNA (cytidine(1402)-2'-O)-methyltransferase [Deltaproteobacteria bacterium]
MSGVLYIVATPLGNMEDITFRAVRVLGEVDIIAAEDTRRTKKLLVRYAIKAKTLTSYHEHSEKKKTDGFIKNLLDGRDVALVTDAGTPAISDPGYRIVKSARENNINVVAVPGASAVTAALSVAGLPTDEFTFKGFVPSAHAKRRSFIVELKSDSAATYVLYETAGRIIKTLEALRDILGSDTEVFMAREMTKLHEETTGGSVEDLIEELQGRVDKGKELKGQRLKGEITLIVRTTAESRDDFDLTKELTALLKADVSLKDSVKTVAAISSISKSEIYKEALKLKDSI